MSSAVFRVPSQAIRTVLRWQIIVTSIGAALAAVALGSRGAIAVTLGGAIGMVAALAFDFAAGDHSKAANDAGAVVFRALRAEAVKIGVMLALLVAVLLIYKDVMKVPFIAAFIVSMLSLSAAFFVREDQ